jgi:uridine kinase
MFHQSIQQLVTSRSVPVPRYSYVTHQRLEEVDMIDHADVVIVEGILTLYNPEVRELLDMKIYVDTDDDVRLARRSRPLIHTTQQKGREWSEGWMSWRVVFLWCVRCCSVKRDIAERGRSVDDVLHQYLYTVKPAFDEFIAPVSAIPPHDTQRSPHSSSN